MCVCVCVCVRAQLKGSRGVLQEGGGAGSLHPGRPEPPCAPTTNGGLGNYITVRA